MDIKSEMDGDTLVVAVDKPRIDAAVAVEFKERMRAILKDIASHVRLDLSAVAFVDSSGLGALVAVMKMVDPPHQFEVMGLTPMVEKVFRLTRMDSIMTVRPALVSADEREASAL